jgi:CAAX prenyl protease-like protein
VTLIAMLALGPYLPLPAAWAYPIRTVAVLAVLLAVSGRVIALRPSYGLSSTLLGMAVFATWILPELLFPGYRQHWLFHNVLLGARSLAGAPHRDPVFLIFRVAGSVLLVPIVEELFWRAWMMRRLISTRFDRVAPGTYSAESFWLTALLFASEHGPYWEVGLAAGIAYNWWMLRTKSVADCILAHAVTNGCLAAYVLLRGQWQYWI